MSKKTGGTNDKVGKLDLGGTESSRRTLVDGQMSSRTGTLGEMTQPDPTLGFLIASSMVYHMIDKYEEGITVIETLKKIPEFNANLSVEYAL